MGRSFIRNLSFGLLMMSVALWSAHAQFSSFGQGRRAEIEAALTIPLFVMALAVGQTVIYGRDIYWVRASLQLSVLTVAVVGIALTCSRTSGRIAAVALLAAVIAASQRRWPLVGDSAPGSGGESGEL